MRKHLKGTGRLLNLPFHPPSIIAIIPITYLPFPVLVMASAHRSEQVFISELLFESFSLHGICRQQVGACLFLGKEKYLRTAIVVEDNTDIELAILVLGNVYGIDIGQFSSPFCSTTYMLSSSRLTFGKKRLRDFHFCIGVSLLHILLHKSRQEKCVLR